jgi:RNA-directed DNA polymerase
LDTILEQRRIAVRENRQWTPAISYCRYADDFLAVVKGTKAHAEAVREAFRAFLEGKLKLTLNTEKTHITHANDGFIFLGHRIIRKRGPRGRMRPVTTIPWEKYRSFTNKLVKELSGNYSVNRMDLVESLNRKVAGWANFYQYTDYTERTMIEEARARGFELPAAAVTLAAFDEAAAKGHARWSSSDPEQLK